LLADAGYLLPRSLENVFLKCLASKGKKKQNGIGTTA
jgi:hypothetical protein